MHPCFIRLFCIASAPFCSSSVLLVSPPSLPQLGAILPSSQAAPTVSQPVTSQHAARIVSHLAAGSLPQVRVVSTQSGLVSTAGSQQATMVHQTPHQIRMPVSVAAKGISQVARLSAFFYCCAYCECIKNSVWICLCVSIGSGFCTSEESVC